MNDADANPEQVDGAGQKGAENVHANDAPDDPLPPEEIGPVSGLTPQQTEELRKRYLLRRFLISARGFWSRRGDGLAWPFSIGLLVMIGVNVGFQYGINIWNRGIFDAIEKRDASTVYFLASIFPPLVLGSVFIVTSQVYVRMRIQRRWRSWLTKVLLSPWIANGRYYQLNLIDGDYQNPEARLSEEMRIATEAPVDFVAGVIAA